MQFLYLKAIHIIFIVSWFAALFYIVRLFIYATDAQSRDEIAKPILTAQLVLMQKKLWYIIGWPAMTGTFVFGWWMFFLNTGFYISQPWMWLKLSAVGLLTIYHLECQRILSQQKKGVFKFSSFRLRLFNELATVLLVAIIFLVIVRSTLGLVWGVTGLLCFAGTLMLAVFIYKRARNLEKAKVPDAGKK